MADEARAAAGSEVISEERLRKAEEYVQQEEGAANRLSGWVGIVVTGIALRWPQLRRLHSLKELEPAPVDESRLGEPAV